MSAQEFCAHLNRRRILRNFNIPDDVITAPWQVGAGGCAVPFSRCGRSYILVWNTETKQHAYYCFDDATFTPDRDFNDPRGL
jgi:hypothetical protein